MSAKVTDLPAGVASGAIFYAVNGSADHKVTGGAANGVATLDAAGKLPAAQSVTGALTYKGDWNASTNTPTLANGVGSLGDTHIVKVAGTQNLGGGSASYAVGDMLVYDGAEWDHFQSGSFVVPAGANPTAQVGLTAANGAAATFMRSDAAPPISQAIAPQWSAMHTFVLAGSASQSTLRLGGLNPYFEFFSPNAPTDEKKWIWRIPSPTTFAFSAFSDTGIVIRDAYRITRAAGEIAQHDFLTANTVRVTINSGGVGIGTPTPHAPLQTDNGIVNRKIVIFEAANNDHQYYGFGVNSNVLRYQTSGTTASHVFYAGASASASNELFRIWGTGGFLSSAAGQVITGVDGNKLWLGKYSSGTGHNNAPTSIGAESTYLQIGGREYGNNGFGGIGFSYVSAPTDHPAVWIGWEERNTAGNTNGDFIIATRSVTTNTAPTERLRVTNLGALAVGGMANTGTNGQVLTSTGPGTPPAWTTLPKAAAQANSTATDIAGIVADFNSLLAKLRTAGLLAT